MKRLLPSPTLVSLFEEPIVLRQSFGFLDHKDMRTCRLTCKLWRDTLFAVPNFLTYYFSKTEVIKGKTSQESYEIFTRLVKGNYSVSEYTSHESTINSVLAQNNYIFSCSQDCSIRYFDLKSNNQENSGKIFSINQPVDEIALLNNQSLAGTAFQTLWVWDFIADTRRSFSFSNDPLQPNLSYNLSKVVSYKENPIFSCTKIVDEEVVEGVIFHLDLATQNLTKLFSWIGVDKNESDITPLQLDGDSLAGGCLDGTIILIDLAAQKNVIKKIHSKAISSLVFCGSYLISSDTEGRVKVADRCTLEIITDNPLPKAMTHDQIYQLTSWNKMIISVSHGINRPAYGKLQHLKLCKLWNLAGLWLPIEHLSFPITNPITELSLNQFKPVVVNQDNFISFKEKHIIVIDFSNDKKVIINNQT
jgi:WD40 repeat protein